MTPELSHRCALLLFVALAMAVACGLLAAPVLDPLAPLRRLPLAGTLLAAMCHGSLAWLGLSLTQRWLAPASSALPSRAFLGLLVGAALAWWMASLLLGGGADARILLWLQTLPLWALVAGLPGGFKPAGRRGRALPGATFPQRGKHPLEHLGAVDHGHVRRARNVPGAGAGQQRAGGRKDNVVAMAEAAQEQAAA